MSPKNISKLHGMRDDRWVISDKLSQYRGLISLFTRDRKKTRFDGSKKRRSQARDYRALKNDCKKYRKDLENSLYGNKQRIRNVLQDHRDKQLAYEGLKPYQVEDYLEHVNTTKLKELDRLKYKKKQRMKVFENLCIELADLQDKHNTVSMQNPQRRAERKILRSIENMYVKQNAAENIKKIYQHILELLHKDSSYFDAVLSSIRSDVRVQCRCVIRATDLGQFATEDLANTNDEYKYLEKEVKINMKARDNAVKDLRLDVAELQLKCKMFVRTDSDVALKKVDVRTVSEIALPQQVAQLEAIMNQVQKVTLVSTYDDIFPRMTDQQRQLNRLLSQLEMNIKLRDDLLNMRNHAELMLTSLKHAMADTTFQYKEDKNKLVAEIEDENVRTNREEEQIEESGQILVLLRISLQALFELLSYVRDPEEMLQDEHSSSHSLTAKEESLVFDIPPSYEKDTKRLLRLIAKKLYVLVTFTAEYIKTDVPEESKDFFLQEMMRAISVGDMDEADAYDLPLVGENETDDVNVWSRLEVKLRSQKLVNKFEKPLFDLEPVPTFTHDAKRRVPKRK